MSEYEFEPMSEEELWIFQRMGTDHMKYYRKIFRGSPRLISGKIKADSHVILYADQGCGDVVMLLRFLPALMQKCKVTLLCPPPLVKLVKSQWNVGIVEKTDDAVLPDHDFHLSTMDMIYVIGKTSNKPYIKINEFHEDVKKYPNPIGIAWEGSMGNINNKIRCCPLKHFRNLNGTLFMLHHEIYIDDLLEDAKDMQVLSTPIKDFYDTAVLINSVDKVVTIDSAALHLAGAMGKETYALIPYKTKVDPRWGEEGEETIWYPSVHLIRQKSEGNWGSCFGQLNPHYLISHIHSDCPE